MGIAKNNPSEDPYRKQLTNDNLDTFIDDLNKKPFCLEKKVYCNYMHRYEDQVLKRVKQRSSGMTNMVDAREWERDTLAEFHKYALPVIGYEYDEEKASLVSTAKLRSFRMSRGAMFSGTVETTDRLKRHLGYATAIIVVVIVLAGGYILRKVALKAMDTIDARSTILERVADPNE